MIIAAAGASSGSLEQHIMVCQRGDRRKREDPMKMATIGGLLLLAGGASLLGACQDPVSSRTGDQSTVQNFATGGGDSAFRQRRCCHRASRGSNN